MEQNNGILQGALMEQHRRIINEIADIKAEKFELTEDDKKAIKIEMVGEKGDTGKKAEINNLIKAIKDRHSGNNDIDKAIVTLSLIHI